MTNPDNYRPRHAAPRPDTARGMRSWVAAARAVAQRLLTPAPPTPSVDWMRREAELRGQLPADYDLPPGVAR